MDSTNELIRYLNSIPDEYSVKSSYQGIDKYAGRLVIDVNYKVDQFAKNYRTISDKLQLPIEWLFKQFECRNQRKYIIRGADIYRNDDRIIALESVDDQKIYYISPAALRYQSCQIS